MTATSRLGIVPLGISLALFFAFSYVLCTLIGLVVPELGMHTFFADMLPGFVWLTLPGFLIGFVWSIFYGWYIAVVFVPIYNFCTVRFGAKQGTGHA